MGYSPWGCKELDTTEWLHFLSFLSVYSDGSDGKASARNAGDLGSIPGLGKFPGGGKGYSHSSILPWRIP